MTNILVIEDSPQFQLLIQNALGNRFHFSFARTLAAGRLLLLEEAAKVDLILLDVVLPDGTGFQFLGEIKSDLRLKMIPVILLTSKGDVTDKVLGLSLGADDYVMKPFEPLELRARVDSKLSKAAERGGGETLKLGSLRIDLFGFRAFLVEGGKTRNLNLTATEFKLLSHLARHPDHVMSRERLLEACSEDLDTATDRTVDKHIWGLRKKMGSASGYIETVPSLGYRFSIENPSATEL